MSDIARFVPSISLIRDLCVCVRERERVSNGVRGKERERDKKESAQFLILMLFVLMQFVFAQLLTLILITLLYLSACLRIVCSLWDLRSVSTHQFYDLKEGMEGRERE